MSVDAHRCLVLGGARSGKSSWAEARLRGSRVRYLATGYPVGERPDRALAGQGGADLEWQARLQLHRDRRPASWTTYETLEVAAHLRADDPRPVLLDCATLWLTRTLDALDAWSSPNAAAAAVRPAIDGFADALAVARTGVIVVSNEVGSGVVPATTSGRIFADLLGELNVRLAAACDEVVLMVAGIPLAIKGSAPRCGEEQ